MTAKELLALLDQHLSTMDREEAKAVLNVLSALRGPDGGSDLAKYHGTNHIRHAALPRTCVDNPAGWYILFKVTIETRDGYEKEIEAKDEAEARALIEAEDGWGSPDRGWERTDDCYSAIERVEEV